MAQMQFDATEDDLKVWLAEADEQIELLQNDVIRLEQESDDAALVAGIFRAAHTLKGSSAMIGHKRMAELTHGLESLFGTIRDGKLTPSAEVVDLILQGLDGLSALREEVVTKQERTDVDLTGTVEALLKVVEGAGGTVARMPGQAAPAGAAAAAPGPPQQLQVSDDENEAIHAALDSGAAVWILEIDFVPDSPWLAVRAFQVLTDLPAAGELIKSKPTSEEIEAEQVGVQMQVIIAGDPGSADTIAAAVKSIEDVANVRLIPFVPGEQSPEAEGHSGAAAQAEAAPDSQGHEEPASSAETLPVPAAPATPAPASAAPSAPAAPPGAAAPPRAEPARAAQNVRVDVARLDTLMNLVGELVTERNHLQQLGLELEAAFGARDAIDSLNEAAQSLGRITNDLQEEVMTVRMQPIETVFNKFPRLVRDLSRQLGKEVDLIIEGKDETLDRSVLERIDDPLIHLLRNAVDHGMEMPDERRAQGKSPKGTVRLSAWREENHVVIAVQDDGPGMDPAKLKSSAVRKGVITQEVADRMDDRAAIDLIFAPGFSTAAKTTEVSGRGVGMDIVRANIEKLSGSVTPESSVGRGTRFLIKLPMTLAIIRALLVEVGGRKFALPMAGVETTLRLDASVVRTVQMHQAIQWSGRILPLASLRDLLRLPLSLYPPPKTMRPAGFDGGASDGNGHARGNGHGNGQELAAAALATELVPYAEGRLANKMFVVVIRVGDRQMGLQVDQLVGEQEIVIKPLSRFLGELRGVAGVTTLGDGQVAIICDIPSLINRVVQEQLMA